MIKVKIKTDHNHRFTIPVPYSILRICCSLFTSPFLWRLANKWMNSPYEKTRIPFFPSDPISFKYFLSSVVEEIQRYKGLVVVDVKLKDGTAVQVQL